MYDKNWKPYTVPDFGNLFGFCGTKFEAFSIFRQLVALFIVGIFLFYKRSRSIGLALLLTIIRTVVHVSELCTTSIHITVLSKTGTILVLYTRSDILLIPEIVEYFISRIFHKMFCVKNIQYYHRWEFGSIQQT